VGCLAWFAWISSAIGLLQWAVGGPRLARWSQLWLSDLVIPASVGISVLLLANVAITAISNDPVYRYDFSLLLLKFMLGGIGCAVLIELVKRIGLGDTLFVFFRRMFNHAKTIVSAIWSYRSASKGDRPLASPAAVP
jgi:hypothetical protein